MSQEEQKLNQNPAIYGASEINSHNKRNTLWLIISGKVYDLTIFQNEHPGGSEILVNYAGKNATIDFENIGHSENALEIMKKYFIGVESTENSIVIKPPFSFMEFISQNRILSIGATTLVLAVCIFMKSKY